MRSLLALLCLCWSVLAAAQQAGKVDDVEGSVKVLDAAQRERSVKVGDAILAGETVVTGSDGELHIAMQDGGHLGIRPNTRMRIEKYKAEGGADDTSVFNLVQGAMRSVTGWIGKYNARNYAIKTSTATIGVRGTDHETRVIPAGSSEGEAGTYDKVNVGETEMRTQYGSTRVRPNQAGFLGFGSRARPRVLDRVPEFFRPMRSEKRFDGLHDKVKSRVEGLRQDRVKFLQNERLERRRNQEGERLQRQQQGRQEWQGGQHEPRGVRGQADTRRQFRDERPTRREAGEHRSFRQESRQVPGQSFRSDARRSDDFRQPRGGERVQRQGQQERRGGPHGR